MRILLVSHPALSMELGAAQIALNLAAALRERGHAAEAWSPDPLPATTRWWNVSRQQRAALVDHARASGPYDVIDTPAITAGAPLRACTRRLVARSVQPELRYVYRDAIEDLRRRPSARAVAHAMVAIGRAAAIVAGWRRSDRILCLGAAEKAWMRRRFPAWNDKLAAYRCAPSTSVRDELRRARAERGAPTAGPCRYLWLGRWSAQKGTRTLLRFAERQLVASPADRLTIAGCGPAAQREISPRLRASGRVQLVESFSRSELVTLLSQHDAGLFTSRVEGWGLGLVEMLEAGLPVFATRAGAVDDLAPFFPASLQPFPPGHPTRLPPVREDLEANGYYRHFSWDEIAADYEAAVRAGTAA